MLSVLFEYVFVLPAMELTLSFKLIFVFHVSIPVIS